MDHLTLGLQKWVGWKEGDQDECCLKGEGGIGKKCDCPSGVGAGCCTGGTKCHECSHCGTSEAGNKCYLSAYCKSSSTKPPKEDYLWTSISSDCTKVHLLARIFLGSVCLIWSGLSHLGFLTKEGSDNNKRWREKTLTSESEGLGSFMAAMGYDLERLNQGSGGTGGNTGNGEFVWNLLSGTEPDKDGIKWQEFASVKGKLGGSVAEYYSTIYSTAQSAAKKTEDICTKYPLLVLHILASGYFRAGSAGAKGIKSPPKAATSDATKDTSPRKPRTIREILYWLSALPYSKGYRELVERMKEKYPRKEDDPKKLEDDIKLYDEKAGPVSTTLLQKDITHYLTAACGYCPLVLIGIQGTIEREVDKTTGGGPGGSGSSSADKRCPKHKKDPKSKRCTPEEASKTTENGQQQSTMICYGGYHLDVSKFGPLHGMYANGLYGFDMDGSPAQCLDQLRVYVYHCFYQLYFLRKQCSTGVENKAVLGWQSCRYGYQVSTREAKNNRKWTCDPLAAPGVGVPGVGVPGVGPDKCKCLGDGASQGPEGSKDGSPLQSFLCDSILGMHCDQITAASLKNYPKIEDHMNTKDDNPPGHYEGAAKHCPVPMGWQSEGSKTSGENHFKDLTQGSHKTEELESTQAGKGTPTHYPAHCTGNTLSHLLEYYCDPAECHGTLVVLLRLLVAPATWWNMAVI